MHSFIKSFGEKDEAEKSGQKQYNWWKQLTRTSIERKEKVTRFLPPIRFRSSIPTSEPFRMPKQTFPMFWKDNLSAFKIKKWKVYY